MAETTAVPAPPLTEKGYVTNAASQGSWWWSPEDAFEHVPELMWPLSVDVFNRMRSDAQVMSVLRAVVLPIVRSTWRVDPNGARDEVVEFVAKDLGLPIAGATDPLPTTRRRGRFSWDEHLRTALLMLTFGHSYFEQEARLEELSGGVFRWHLKRLGPRLPRTISKVNVARDGGLVSIEQHGTKEPIPVRQLVAYVHEKEGGNWLGRSLLRSAWKFWLLKDRALKTQALTLERNGLGVPTYTGAEGEQSLEAGLNMAKSVRGGSNAGIAIANTAEFELKGVTGTLPDADKPIRYYDEQIARAVLAHFLNLGTQTGSWALGSTFADFFVLSLQSIADQVDDVATSHIVEDLVDWNWGVDEAAPAIVHDEIGSNPAVMAQTLKALVDAGVVFPDRVLEEFMRQVLNVPPKAIPPPAPPAG